MTTAIHTSINDQRACSARPMVGLFGSIQFHNKNINQTRFLADARLRQRD